MEMMLQAGWQVTSSRLVALTMPGRSAQVDTEEGPCINRST